MINTFSVVPSPIENGTVLDYYNSVLTFKHLSQNSDGCYLFDNQALRKICQNQLKIKMVNINHTNDLISRTMLSLTGFQRLSNSQPNIDLAVINQQLVSAPKLHFFVPALNFLNKSDHFYKEIKSSVIYSLLSIKKENWNVFSVASILYGNLHQQIDLNEFHSSLRWNKANKICGSCESSDGKNSVVNVLNSKGILDVFDRIFSNYSKAFQTRSFVMSYVGEGMEEGEFGECLEELKRLKDEYSKDIEIKPNSLNTNVTNLNTVKQTISVNTDKPNLPKTNRADAVNINLPNFGGNRVIKTTTRQGQDLNPNLSKCCVLL